jgi:hypothetical protein
MKIGNESLRPEISTQPETTLNRENWLTPRISFLLIAITLLVVFWRVIFGADVFFYRDAGAFGYPMDFYESQSLAHGQLPLWNPYDHCGVPFLAQWGRWYPVSFLSLILPVAWFASLTMVAHLFWGGMGMYWLCRRWQVGVYGATFAGVAYIFNGATLSCLNWSHYIASLSWLPWVIGCVIAAWKTGGRWIPLAALASAMQVLTASPELTVPTWLFLGALWLSGIFAREINFFVSARRLCAVVGLAGGITMVQMLPFFDLLRHSQRTAATGEMPWSVPSWGLANLLVPLFHCFTSPQGTWFQEGQEFMASYYLGAGVLLLGIAGAIWNRSRRNAVLAAAAVFCWIMAMGPHSIIFNGFRHIFPWISVARYPAKFAILPAFLVPILAGCAIERIASGERREQTRRTLVIMGIAALLCMAGILWAGKAHPFEYDRWNTTALHAVGVAALMIAMIGCVLLVPVVKSPRVRITLQLACLAALPIDALTHSPNIAPTAPASILAPGMWEAKGNPPVPLTEGRVMIHPEAEQKLIYSHVENLQVDFLVKRVGQWYNLNLLDGVPKLTGAIILRPASFDVLEQYLYNTDGAHYGQGLLDFLSVAWISSPDNPADWHPRTNSLPLMTGGQRPIFVAEDKLLSAITSDEFNPGTEVYFSESARALVSVSNQNQCVIQDVRFTSGKMEAAVQCAAPSIIVLSESYYHCWHAFVDDKPVELLRANLAFQALQTPAGTHRIKIVYRDPNLLLGGILSASSLAVCAVIWWRTKKSNWRVSSFEG